MELRELKALEIAARSKIAFDNGVWVVPSQTSTSKYRVTLDPAVTCQCEDFQLHLKPCKHIIAARLVLARDYGGTAPAIVVNAVPKRPTYKQDWPAYNRAQIEEKFRFRVLLAELCAGVAQLPNPVRGQQRAPTSDVIFAAVFKVYTTLPGRRFMTDLREAQERGYITQAISHTSISRHLEDPALTTILTSLIVQSSLPLVAVETDFAPDSTGFSTSRFIRWFDEKYGCVRSGHDWVKVHIMTGVRTNIVTAAEVHGRDANDSPIMPSLLKTTVASGFTVKEVPCDKGYSSIENIEAIAAVGATPFIAFKSSATGAAGGLWEKMFHFYQFKRDEFLQHYHKRSNVESTFSMIKAKFRDHVRSKHDVAMKNEVLCKILAHNLCVLIQSHCELGIETVFWPKQVEADPDILPLARPS